MVAARQACIQCPVAIRIHCDHMLANHLVARLTACLSLCADDPTN